MTVNDRIDLGLTDSGAGCECCATASAPAEIASGAGALTEVVLVHGMTCSHCVMSVTEELTDIDGVGSVSVDLNAGGASRVTIRSAARINPSAVRSAVEGAGYTLAGSSA